VPPAAKTFLKRKVLDSKEFSKKEPLYFLKVLEGGGGNFFQEVSPVFILQSM
jgi:hypothetical protein